MAADIYEAQGYSLEHVRELMAHTSSEMTEHYQHDRREKFVTVQAGLKLE